MRELFPIGAGVLIGLVVPALRLRYWPVITALLAIVVGFLAAYFSGELEISPAFFVFDVGQVLVAALVTAVIVETWRRRETA